MGHPMMPERPQTIVGMTGHRDLHDVETARWVSGVVGAELERVGATAGVCCLAVGADQIFAEELLRRGLALVAVIPSQRYDETFETSEDRARYRALVTRSTRAINLAHKENTEEAFLAGGLAVVDGAPLLMAVWDEQPSRGLGGTADIVAYARGLGRRIIYINPFRRSVARPT